mmetsp:Transcript_1291/g.5502  ORF Transcript_1291/g.5502 Transcript_1291/m.5502 type:complete len:459 (+) Transcript_1291:1666-3042(+)
MSEAENLLEEAPVLPLEEPLEKAPQACRTRAFVHQDARSMRRTGLLDHDEVAAAPKREVKVSVEDPKDAAVPCQVLLDGGEAAPKDHPLLGVQAGSFLALDDRGYDIAENLPAALLRFPSHEARCPQRLDAVLEGHKRTIHGAFVRCAEIGPPVDVSGPRIRHCAAISRCSRWPLGEDPLGRQKKHGRNFNPAPILRLHIGDDHLFTRCLCRHMVHKSTDCAHQSGPNRTRNAFQRRKRMQLPQIHWLVPRRLSAVDCSGVLRLLTVGIACVPILAHVLRDRLRDTANLGSIGHLVRPPVTFLQGAELPSETSIAVAATGFLRRIDVVRFLHVDFDGAAYDLRPAAHVAERAQDEASFIGRPDFHLLRLQEAQERAQFPVRPRGTGLGAARIVIPKRSSVLLAVSPSLSRHRPHLIAPLVALEVLKLHIRRGRGMGIHIELRLRPGPEEHGRPHRRIS